MEEKVYGQGRSTVDRRDPNNGRRTPTEPMDHESSETSKRRRSCEKDSSVSKRYAGEGQTTTAERSRRVQEIVYTRPDNVQTKTGNLGRKVSLRANYFPLVRTPKWSIHKYWVEFEPEVHLKGLRNALVFQHKPQLGGYLFDGTQLFVMRQLKTDAKGSVQLISNSREGVTYTLTLRHTKEVLMTESESIQVLNLILRRAMAGLNLQLIGRNLYDPKSKVNIPQYNIQLWSGYDTSIRKHEHEILLNVDITHKVLRTDTVYKLMQDTHNKDPQNFQKNLLSAVLGITVLTEYNNKTYRIDDVMFDKSPSCTFKKNDVEVSFMEYYMQRYNKKILDANQPLLVTKANSKAIRGGQDQMVLLIPELCVMTGLSENQRIDMNLKKDLKPYNMMQPNIRMDRLIAYSRRLQSTPESAAVLNDFNLRMGQEVVKIDGRVIEPQKILFGNGFQFLAEKANWDRECGKPLFLSIPLKRWYIVHPEQMRNDTRYLVACLIRLGREMRFEVAEPRIISTKDDRQIISALDECINNNPQIIMCIINNNSNDCYSNIKKKLCLDRGVPSQVVTRRTVTRKQNFDSVVKKIGIQMCAKIGGAPWTTVIPLKGVMTIGFDLSNDSTDKRISYSALVATMDLKEGPKFFSAVSKHTDSNNLSSEFSWNVMKALRAYKEEHNTLPEKIFIYRGGVGDGQIKYVRDTEVNNLEQKLKETYANANAELNMIFILVTKRINTRIFGERGNPTAGTVVDDVITLPERYDFFLISQNVTQGTVSPTSYNVIYDSMKMPPERVQIWTYKNTHLYYNWAGTTRVPAVVQYATKLSFLVANSIHRVPCPNMDKKLYFL